MSKPELDQSLPGKQRSFTASVPPPCLAVKPPVLASKGTQCNACTSPWPRQQPPKLIEASYQWLMVFGSITSPDACPNAIRLLSLDIEQSATQKSPSLHTSIPSIPKCFSAVAAPQRSSTSTCGSAAGGSASVSRRVAPRPGISKRLDMMRGVAFDLDRYQHSSFHQSSRPYPVFPSRAEAERVSDHVALVLERQGSTQAISE
ncbi:hypothetical protein IWZ01DRAFT_39067 [Phyllosticta capitalensis]